jgi:hypothetical protein
LFFISSAKAKELEPDAAPAWAQNSRGNILSLQAEVIMEQADFKKQIMGLLTANGGMPANHQPGEVPKKRQMGSSDNDKEGKPAANVF